VNSRRFFVLSRRLDDPVDTTLALPAGYRAQLWNPEPWQPVPPGVEWSWRRLGLWAIFRFGLGKRQYYSLLIANTSGDIVHQSHVFPKTARFPFMAATDIQIGMTWTKADCRGLGLASYAIQEILQSEQGKRRFCWYVVGESNAPSIKAAVKNGFEVVGTGTRKQTALARLFTSFDVDLTSPVKS